VKPHQFLGIHREKMLATIMLFKYWVAKYTEK
jgi:hypothetical protein